MVEISHSLAGSSHVSYTIAYTCRFVIGTDANIANAKMFQVGRPTEESVGQIPPTYLFIYHLFLHKCSTVKLFNNDNKVQTATAASQLSVQTVMQKGWPLVLGVCVVVCVLLCVCLNFFWKF